MTRERPLDEQPDDAPHQASCDCDTCEAATEAEAAREREAIPPAKAKQHMDWRLIDAG